MSPAHPGVPVWRCDGRGRLGSTGRGQLHLSGLDLDGLHLDRLHRLGRTGDRCNGLSLDHPLVNGAGSGLACGGGTAAAKIDDREACAWNAPVRAAGSGASPELLPEPEPSGSAGRPLRLPRLGRLRSVIAATVRCSRLSRFSASRLRMMASRELPLRPPSPRRPDGGCRGASRSRD